VDVQSPYALFNVVVQTNRRLHCGASTRVSHCGGAGTKRRLQYGGANQLAVFTVVVQAHASPTVVVPALNAVYNMVAQIN
jgi:hypothetical protein